MDSRHCAALVSLFCILACGTSCVYIDEELGSDFIPIEQRYNTYIDEFPLTEIGMLPVEKLSGYNSDRVTVGAIRSDDGEICTRSSAFTLIPATEYDFGKGGEVVRFHFAMAKDTMSFIHENQKRILQDVNIYALEAPIDKSDGYIGSSLKVGDRIADVATYDGGDSLSFDFSSTWAAEFLDDLQQMEKSVYDSVGAFAQKVFPGIYIDMDTPATPGGRINLFSLATGINLSEYVLTGGYATLTVKNVEFEGKGKRDTSFMFLYGAQDFSLTQEATDYYSGETVTPQYALNLSTSTLDSKATDKAASEIIVDGGGGLKPVIKAKYLRDNFIGMLQEKGIDPNDVVVNKASIILPYDSGADYGQIDSYPALLSPTCKVRSSEDNEESVSYAGISDASASSENQGDIDRSNKRYAPDISYHMQQILALDEYDGNDPDIVKEYEEKDIWLLTLAVEQSEEEQEGISEYMQNLQYSMYYNNLYNYGYGGYGYGYGYGGYYGGYGDYGYNNYYNYYNMAAYYSAMQNAQSQGSTTTILDRDRYYRAVLRGPEANTDETKPLEERRVPYFKVTYSVRQK